MKIIVAIDGSDSSRAAMDVLENIKWEAGSEIKLVMVVERLEGGFGFGKSEAAIKQQEETRAQISEALQGMTNELQNKFADCKFTFEVSEGDPKSQISEIAKQWSANLILIGSRGHKGLDLILLGSVSQGVLMQAECPVLVAKSAISDSYKKVVVTMDNSPYSRAALMWMSKINWGDSCQFKLTTVIQPIIESFDSISSIANTSTIQIQHDALVAAAKTELEKYADDLSKLVGKERVSIEIVEGDAREAIVNLATSWGAELVVMGSHGRTGLTKLMLGSVSQAVALHSPISVLIVKGIVPKGQSRLQQTGMFNKI